jgi:uncharacterized protein YbjQ (UPF0145 family)
MGRSRNAFAQIGAGFKSMFGGELQGMTKNLADVWTEICAYGTAVQAVPVSDAAKYTASQLGYGARS